MRLDPAKAVVTRSPKTSLVSAVSQSDDSFSTEEHCDFPNQNLSLPTPISLTSRQN